MKRLDENKVSLVDFLRSIKFSTPSTSGWGSELSAHFASFKQQARTRGQLSNEESQLIRSAN
ncbi:MAG: hypothetical protein P8Y92_05070 [Halioglobus sp.]|jgi:hypothetical protein